MSDVDEQLGRVRARVLDGPLVLSAGAGSGKTTTLIEAYLAAVRKLKLSGVPRVFDKILAVTFTNAATYDFKRKVQNRIVDNKEDIEPFLTSQEISTIHSACQRILSTLALNLGLNPATEVFEEDRDRNLAFEILDRTIADAVRSGGGILDLLSRYDYVRYGYGSGLRDMLLDFHSKTRVRGWTIVDTLERCRRGVLDLESTLRFDRRLVEGWLMRNGIIRAPAQLGQATDTLRQIITASREFLDLYERFAERFEREKARHGYISHDDSLYYVEQALRLSSVGDSIRTHLSSRHKLALIDEYQDTDPIQDRIVEAIEPEKGAFRVGDVKQSIYRFRRAEPRIFQTWVTDAGTRPRELESLRFNWRSRHSLVWFTNYVFRSIFNPAFLPGNGLGGVRFEELVPRRDRPVAEETELDSFHPVEVYRIQFQDIDMMYQEEATFIARRIRQLAGNFRVYRKHGKEVAFEKCNYGDIAVLVRVKSNQERLNYYLEALRAENIPYVVRDHGGFFDEYSIDLLLTFVRHLNTPADHLLQAVILRSAAFGVSDQTLLRLAENGHVLNDEFITTVTDQKDWEALKRFNAVSRDLQGKKSLSKRRLLLEIIRATNLDFLFYSTVNGSQDYANILQLVDMAGSFDSEINGSLDAFLGWVDNLKESTEQSQAGVYDEQSDAVKVMTIHGSKGLEFPVVFVPMVFRKFRFWSEPYFVSDAARQALPDGRTVDIPFLLKPGDVGLTGAAANQARMMANSFFRPHVAQERVEYFNEEWRLLYVAFTRARDLLVFSLCPGQAQDFHDKITAGGFRGTVAETGWNTRLVDLIPGVESQGEVTLATR